MMTKAEMIEVMEIYVKPIYELMGSILAAIVIIAAVYFVIYPFMQKRKF